MEGFRRNQNYVLTSCVSEYESIDPGPIINVCLFSIFFQNLTLQIGKVLELEDFVITPERRKQFRFLSHLPLGSLASAAELDLGVSTTSLPPQVVEEMTRRKKRAE